MPPILAHKHYDRPSVFQAASLLRETRRQKGVPPGPGAQICVLDPDGDLARHLRDEGTSHHYLPPASYAHLPAPVEPLAARILAARPHIVRGGAWTTDAPFRKTAEALAFAKSENLLQ